MRLELLAAVNRYQELLSHIDVDEHPDDIADLLRGGYYLIQLMAREIVLLGKAVRHEPR